MSGLPSTIAAPSLADERLPYSTNAFIGTFVAE